MLDLVQELYMKNVFVHLALSCSLFTVSALFAWIQEVQEVKALHKSSSTQPAYLSQQNSQ